MRRLLVAAMLSALVLTGCGKEDETVAVPAVEQTVEQTTQPVETETQYNLTPVEEGTTENVGDDTEVTGDTQKSTDVQTTSDNTESNATSIPVEEMDVQDIVDRVQLPDNWAIEIDTGSMGLVMIMGGKGDYQMEGVPNCLMFETEEGTFYYDGKVTKEVEVDGRSALFTEDEDEDEDDVDEPYVDTGLGIGTEDMSAEELLEAMNDGELRYDGIEEYKQSTCHVLTGSYEGTEFQAYVDTTSYNIVCIKAEQDGMSFALTIYDYDSITTNALKVLDGTIDDETATDAVNTAIFEKVMYLMMMGLSGGIDGDVSIGDLE